MAPEPVSLQLREHQVRLTDWKYANLVKELHRWVPIFDARFKLDLPSYPILKFEPLRNAYATYAWFRTELGTRDNITFNSLELERDPALILRTLCHELIHLWQHYHGTPARNNYHNAEYRAKALECGLIVDARGCTCGHTDTFTSLLTEHGIHLLPVAAELPLHGAAKRKQKMKKWVCRCPKPTIVRCATDLRATCRRCRRSFRCVS